MAFRGFRWVSRGLSNFRISLVFLRLLAFGVENNFLRPKTDEPFQGAVVLTVEMALACAHEFQMAGAIGERSDGEHGTPCNRHPRTATETEGASV